MTLEEAMDVIGQYTRDARIVAASVVIEAEIKQLQDDLAANAKMLARQCDLAREAETDAFRLARGCLEAQHRAATTPPHTASPPSDPGLDTVLSS